MQFLKVVRFQNIEEREIDDDIDICNIEIVNIVKSDGHSLKHPQNLRYYIKPFVSKSRPMNLNLGWREHIFRKPELESKICNKVEHYLMSQLNDEGRKDELETKSFLNDIQMCSTRGTLQMIMMLPLSEVLDQGKLIATKFKGKIYLGKKSEAWRSTSNPTPRANNQFKFRQYIFANTPQGEPNTDEPVDENQQLFATYHAKLDSLNLLYSAEISGVMNQDEITDFADRKQLNSCKVIVPKVVYEGKPWRQNYRIFDWVTQAHLIGVKDFCIGFAGKNGIISTPIQHFNIGDLTKLQNVKPKACTTFLYKFLLKLQILMADVDSPYTAFVFEWDEQKSNIIYAIHEGKTEYSLLSEDFIEFMQTKHQ